MSVMDSPPTPLRPGPSLRISILLIVAGVALAVPTAIEGVAPIMRAVSSPAGFAVPASVHVHLARATYMIYEDTGAASIGSAFSPDDTVTITPADVTVTDAENANVPVFDRGTVNETRSSDGRRYVGAVRFTTPAAGDYTVDVHNAAPKEVLIARPIADTITAALGWLALAGLGGLVVVFGVVLLIVGAVRRGNATSAFAYATPTPPGWHPDPAGSGRLRYWDGYRWTEHVQ